VDFLHIYAKNPDYQGSWGPLVRWTLQGKNRPPAIFKGFVGQSEAILQKTA
jgi:hypothetical protein